MNARTQPEPTDFDAFPEELRSRRQWVLWKLVVRKPGQKPTKIPFTVDGTAASTTSPDQWNTFEACVQALQASNGKFDGVGYVFSANDPYAGVDLDKCFTLDGLLKGWAVEIVAAAQEAEAYIERSVSGLGLHIIGKGIVGQGRRSDFNDGGVELYDRDRYFTVSGNQIDIGGADGNIATLIDTIRRRFGLAADGTTTFASEGNDVPDGVADELTVAILENATPDFQQFWSDRVDVIANGSDRSKHRLALLTKLAMKLWSTLRREPTISEVRSVALRSPFIKSEMSRGRSKWPRLAKTECPKAIAWAREHRDGGEEVRQERIRTGFISAADFAASAATPDYVVDGILRRGYLYALTGMSNAGKTSIGLRMVRCVNLGENFGAHECVQGRALILAGENPDDVAYRFLAEAQYNSMSSVGRTFPQTTVLPYSFAIDQGLPFIAEQAQKDGGYTLVLVDSKAAYFNGDSEDDNAQAFKHAKFLRELTMLTGRPAVMVICHPIKRPDGPEHLLPRGGSAFLNEIDGNLTAWKPGGADIIEMHYTKIRGVPFDRLNLRLSVLELNGLKTSKGKPVTSVVAVPTNTEDVEKAAEHHARDEDLLLGVIYDDRDGTQRSWALAAGWALADGRPHTGKLSRVLDSLKRDQLVHKPRGSKGWRLTKRGISEVEKTRGKTSADNLSGD